ncbi:MAG: CAP domain-containing protein [Microthrixaceae bacterium]
MTFRTRRWPVLAALALCIALVGAACTKNGEAWESAQLINTERDNRGIPGLALDSALVEKAQAWAEVMAASGVRHSNLADGVPAGWSRLGENVGWARSVGEMHNMFMNSSAHRGAILEGRYTAYGTGVAVVDGRYYVVQVFAG